MLKTINLLRFFLHYKFQYPTTGSMIFKQTNQIQKIITLTTHKFILDRSMISFKIKIIDYLSNRFVRQHIYIIKKKEFRSEILNFSIQSHVKNHCKDAFLFIFLFGSSFIIF